MNIRKERTRIIFSNYTPLERKKIEDLVATIDKVLFYEDTDKQVICIPTGMTDSVRQLFPNVRIEDHSSEYWEYDKIKPVESEAAPRNQIQIDFIDYALKELPKGGKVAGILSPGLGKSIPNFVKIPTPNGHTLMGDLKVGDYVFDQYGYPTKVLGVYPQGLRDIYKIIFNDGRIALCDKDHLWVAKTYAGGRYRIHQTSDMIKDFKKYDENKAKDPNRDPYRYTYQIPVLQSPVKYNHRNVPVDPYTLGALIGNGCLTLPILTISSGNDFVPYKIAKKYGFEVKKVTGSYSYTFYHSIKDRKPVKTKEFFKDLPEMIGKYSNEKQIPESYIYNDTEIRWELMQGLMDTDGCISYDGGRYHVSYSSCSKKLLDQIRFILKGFGFNASMIIDKRVEKYRNGFHAKLMFAVPNSWKKHFFTLPYKQMIAYDASRMPDTNLNVEHLLIKDIKPIGKDYATCILVDSPDHLFLTEDFIVTHNTFMACYIAMKICAKTLIIAPTSSIKAQWGETLTNMFNVPPERVNVTSSPQDIINAKEDFIIASQASLASLNKKYDLEKIMLHNRIGMKIIDEVQMWFHNIIKIEGTTNFRYGLYLTGTFGRSSDEENRIYQTMFSDLAKFEEKQKTPTIFNRKPGNVYGMKPHMYVNMIWTKSGLNKDEIQSVNTSMRYSEREGRWVRYGISVPAYSELVIPKDGTLTRMLKTILKVIQLAEKEVTYGRTLILFDTIAECDIVMMYMEKLFPDKKIGTINSHNTKAQNDQNKAECDIVISTIKSCGTGFDMKDLSKLVVFACYASWILSDQISGRLRRRDDGKPTYMWDIVDASVPQLRAWANKRADVLKRKSKSFKVIDM